MSYNVYVIELDNAVLTSKKFREKNPHMNPRKACFYVGQTTHDPYTRFQQHKTGYKANRLVKKYGCRLAPKIFSHFNPLATRNDAERVEQWIADKLREKGHGVWSN